LVGQALYRTGNCTGSSQNPQKGFPRGFRNRWGVTQGEHRQGVSSKNENSLSKLGRKKKQNIKVGGRRSAGGGLLAEKRLGVSVG